MLHLPGNERIRCSDALLMLGSASRISAVCNNAVVVACLAVAVTIAAITAYDQTAVVGATCANATAGDHAILLFAWWTSGPVDIHRGAACRALAYKCQVLLHAIVAFIPYHA